MNAETALRFFDLAITGLVALERLRARRDELAAIVAEGRDPTPEEWAALFSSIDSNEARLDAADKRLNP